MTEITHFKDGTPVPMVTTWYGKDIEKMSREELLDVVQDLGQLLKQSHAATMKAYELRRESYERRQHCTGLPRR